MSSQHHFGPGDIEQDRRLHEQAEETDSEGNVIVWHGSPSASGNEAPPPAPGDLPPGLLGSDQPAPRPGEEQWNR
jgi:hypothetical protein